MFPDMNFKLVTILEKKGQRQKNIFKQKLEALQTRLIKPFLIL